MRYHTRTAAVAGGLVVAGLLLVSSTARAQTSELARTPWGAPDLQGVWDFRTLTPFERPAELGDKDVLTKQERAEFEASRLAEFAVRDDQDPADVVGNYNQFWFDPGSTAVETNRTSLIISPANGRIPPLTGAAARRHAEIARIRKGLRMHDLPPGGWLEDLGEYTLSVRCITGFNAGPPIEPGGYNQNVQLFQTEDHVVLLSEMIHDARVIPLDGRPHLDGDIRQWAGSSRGYWDGDTLVVETRNFLRETGFRGGVSDEHLQLTERFTRVSPTTLMYEATVDDPTVWSQPWTYQIPMQRNDQPMFEYACHEGNYGLYNILAGAREAELAGEGAK